MRHTQRITALVAAAAGATALTACQDVQVEPTQPATSASVSSVAPQASSSAGPVGPDGSDAGRRERLTQDGGYVVQGSKITFVFRNGMRHQVDVGQSIPDGDTSLRTSAGALLIKGGNATLTNDRGVTTVDGQGTGAVADSTGTVLVSPDGSTTCANSRGLQFVGSDGSRAAADTNGVFYTSKDGETVSSGKKPEVDNLAGRFTVCNVGNTASVDLYSDVLFEFDKAELTPAGRAAVESAARSIRSDVEGKSVKVTGHTDSVGPMSANASLGQRRADAVATELRKQIPGIDLSIRSAGETEPVAANVTPSGQDNPAGRAKNRRVTIAWQK